MIITDDDVQAALDYLNQDPHPHAVASFKVADCKNKRDKVYASLWPRAKGDTVKDRECWVEGQPAYQEARHTEAEAIGELANQKAKQVWADKITDLYQTVSANTRYAERIR
jgi:hypothetical protein